jgi:hypothetical protein
LGYKKDTKVKFFKHPIEKSGNFFNQKEIFGHFEGPKKSTGYS